MNRHPVAEKTKVEKSSRTHVLRATVVAASTVLLAGCVDVHQYRPEDQAPNPYPQSSEVAPPGMVLAVNPKPNGIGWQKSFIAPPANSVKPTGHIGQNTCPSSPTYVPADPQLASSVSIKLNGQTRIVAAGMLDLRCADFAGQSNGVPDSTGNVANKHFIGFSKPNVEAAAVDLGVPTDPNRSPYLSEYVGMCMVQGELFEGADGAYSNTWLAVYRADAGAANSIAFVPYAETGYVQGTNPNPISACKIPNA
ncbi:MAG TPA: hypothetical protein VLG16_01980 [Candidatus Saccharimonadales bacterium]|nr:hypothetical protein [Candidatus Saccharimonadales bacterium]